MSVVRMGHGRLVFGKGISIDVGASNGGSSKFQEIDNAGKPRGPSVNFPIRPVKDGDDFVRAIAENVTAFKQEHPSQFPAKEKYNVIVANLPGQTSKPGFMAGFSNLTTTAGKMVKNIDFNRLPALLGNPQSRLIVVNDVVGGLAEALHQGAQKYPERFHPGEKVTFAITGGGLGIADAEIWHDGQIRIASSECGTVRDETRQGKPLEQARVSVTALKENFLNALRTGWFRRSIPEAQPLPGQIVTDYQAAKKHLPHLSQKRYQVASAKAVDDYMEGLAMAFRWRVHNGTTLMILAGPVVQGVKAYMQEYPKAFSRDTWLYDLRFPGREQRPVMEKVFLNRVYQGLSEAVKDLYAARKVDVLTDIDISNNTIGAKHLIKGKPGPRGDSYVIPVSILE